MISSYPRCLLVHFQSKIIAQIMSTIIQRYEISADSIIIVRKNRRYKPHEINKVNKMLKVAL